MVINRTDAYGIVLSFHFVGAGIIQAKWGEGLFGCKAGGNWMKVLLLPRIFRKFAFQTWFLVAINLKVWST